MNRDITLEELDIVLFHDNCSDGLTSAFIFKYYCEKIGKNIDIYPSDHFGVNIDKNNLIGKNVIMVDLCSTNFEELHDICNKFYVLDHHKTNSEKMKNKDYCYLNINKSGCTLALEYCDPHKNIEFINLIEDRDLFKSLYLNTNDFTMYYYENVFKSKNYELFKQLIYDDDTIDKPLLNLFIDKGKDLNTDKNRIILSLSNKIIIQKIIFNNNEYKIIKFNKCPKYLRADFGYYCMLNYDIDFVVLYYHDKYTGKWVMNLKSIDIKTDTTSLGGKGHRNASKIMTDIHLNEYFKTI